MAPRLLLLRCMSRPFELGPSVLACFLVAVSACGPTVILLPDGEQGSAAVDTLVSTRDGGDTDPRAPTDGGTAPADPAIGDAAIGDAATVGGFTYVPTPSGCVNVVSAGARTYSCAGLTVAATIPDLPTSCPPSGCGLIVELHGDTGTGPLIDAHLDLRQRAAAAGYIVLAPTGPAIGTISGTFYPGSTWGPSQDAAIMTIVKAFADVFHVDPKRRHVTGFSRGGFSAWRLVCSESGYFASAAIGGAGNGATLLTSPAAEPTCFENGRQPARAMDLLLLMGRTDRFYPKIVAVRDAALASYGIPSTAAFDVVNKAAYVQRRTNKLGAPVVEWFDHAYATDPAGNEASTAGHCIPGSKLAANAPQYAIACKPTTDFDWGAAVLDFFQQHPMP